MPPKIQKGPKSPPQTHGKREMDVGPKMKIRPKTPISVERKSPLNVGMAPTVHATPEETKTPTSFERKHTLKVYRHTIFGKSQEEERLEKVIAEILSKRSSSSSFSSLDSEEGYEEQSETATRSNQFMELSSKLLDLSVKSEDSVSEDIDYVSHSTIYSEDDFYERFHVIPYMDEISTEETEEVKSHPTVSRIKERILGEDEGKFVNPITGELIPSDISEGPSAETLATLQAHAPESSIDKRYSSESEPSEFSDASASTAKAGLDTSEDTKVGRMAEDDEHDAYVEFLKSEERKKEEEEQNAEQIRRQLEELLKEQERQLNNELVTNFLDKLIDRVVKKAQYTDEDVFLRKNLDKRKLMQQLSQTMDKLSAEKSSMEFLNRKCAQYYRRKKSLRSITDDYTRERKEQYYNNLEKFNQMMIKETAIQDKCNESVNKCREEYEIVKEKTEGDVHNLENLITSTFHPDKFLNLKATVDSQLTKMTEFREEISRVRLRLLVDQHNCSELSTQMKKLEDFGNGLNFKDYYNLETDTKALDKKNEDRDNILKKLQLQCNENVHAMAHVKERQKWMCQTVSMQDKILKMLTDEKENLRQHVNNLRLKRMKTKQEIHDISFQCGLLDKPTLMLDYDATVATANRLRLSNSDLRNTIERLQKKITALEDLCT